MTSSIVTQTSNCTNCIKPWDFTVYDIGASTTVKSNGTEAEIYFASMSGPITTRVVTDGICLAARLFRVCADDVEFSVIMDSNVNIPDGLNIFGISPKSLTQGPSLIE